jgi:hypothetical protein
MYGEEWIYGLFWNDGHDDYIVVNETPKNGGLYIPVLVPVIAGTRGQYTGLKDKNGVKIFEGDIVSLCDGTLRECSDGDIMIDGRKFKRIENKKKLVVFAAGCFRIENYNPLDSFCVGGENKLTIIGNIHDNPELAAGNKAEGGII